MPEQAPQRLLAVFPQLPVDLAKSAHMLALKYVRQAGWDATVLTLADGRNTQSGINEWYGVRVVYLYPHSMRWRAAQCLYNARRRDKSNALRRVAARLLRPLLWPLSAAISTPDAHAGACDELVAAARQLHYASPFDAVVTLYYPLSAHRVGQVLTYSERLPWLALTKDFYSWPDSLRPRRMQRALNRIKRRREPRAYRGARAIVPISEYMGDYLRTLVPDTPVDVLGHCYDEDAFLGCTRQPSGEGPLILRSVGLTQRQDLPAVESLFAMAAVLHRDEQISSQDLSIHFVGHNGHLVQEMAVEHGIASFVTVSPAVPHLDAMQAMASADCLFYMQTPFGTRRRLTEYLGARRPILSYPEVPGSLADTLLRTSGAGRIAGDQSELRRHLRELIQEHKKEGTLRLQIDEAVVRSQSAEQRAHELAALLNKYTAGSGEQGAESDASVSPSVSEPVGR